MSTQEERTYKDKELLMFLTVSSLKKEPTSHAYIKFT